MTFKTKEPDVPHEDEHGYRMLVVWCTKCTRELWYADSYLDILKHHGKKPYCLPCEKPERYRWEKITDQYGDREVVIPHQGYNKRGGRLQAKDNKDMLPGDKEAVQLKQSKLDLFAYESRERELNEAIEKFQTLRDEVQARIADLKDEIPLLEQTTNRLLNDPQREKKALLSRVKAELDRLTAELDEPEK